LNSRHEYWTERIETFLSLLFPSVEAKAMAFLYHQTTTTQRFSHLAVEHSLEKHDR
jgi:hypothetical protein